MKPVAPHPEAEAAFHAEVDYYETRQEGLEFAFARPSKKRSSGSGAN